MTGLIAGAALFVLNEVTAAFALHYLYIAPTLFVICLVAMVVGSLTTPPPPPESPAGLTWNAAYYREETDELRLPPWYQNYRVFSAILFAGFVTLAVVFR